MAHLTATLITVKRPEINTLFIKEESESIECFDVQNFYSNFKIISRFGTKIQEEHFARP